MQTDVIAFTKVSLPYGWLGNMSPHPVEYAGEQFRTAEALFQAMRFTDCHPAREEIKNQKSPMAAKMVAKRYLDEVAIRPRSPKDVFNMRIVLDTKLDCNPELVPLLLETGDRLIVEDCTKRNDRFWGAQLHDGEWVGRNVLGKLWMLVRKRRSGTNEAPLPDLFGEA